MEIDNFDKILLSIAGALALILIRQIVNRRNQLFIDKRNDFKKAATNFRKAFTDVLLYLQDDPAIEDIPDYDIKFVGQILAENYNSTLSRARIVFHDYLGFINRFRINMTWDRYIYIERSNKEKHYGFEFDAYSHMRKDKAKKLALERVNKLLSFAKV